MVLVKILLTSHGHLAQGIASGFEFIAGKSDHIMTLELDERGIGSYRDRLQELLDGETEPVLILADLKGGTPYNESFKYYLVHAQRIRVVSGLNLPMLLELVPQLSDNTTLNEAVQTVLQAGTNGIAVAQDQQDDEDDIEF